MRRCRTATVSAAVLVATWLMALGTGSAVASTSQEAWLQDDTALLNDTPRALHQLRVLGVTRARVGVRWMAIAPRAGSHTRPHFNAADPAAYPAGNWAPFDRIVKQAQASGITVNFNVGGGAPLWATAPGAPKDKPHPNWMPSAKEFNLFVRALGTRYSGNYDPDTRRTTPGDPGDLPAVTFWSVWNEPDYGPSLAPQGVPGQSDDRGEPPPVPGPGRCRLDRPAPDRPRPRPVPVRRDRAARVRQLRLVQRNAAAAVPPRALLRRRALPTAARNRRHPARLPGERGRLTLVPRCPSRPVQRQRVRRPSVFALVCAQRRATQQPGIHVTG